MSRELDGIRGGKSHLHLVVPPRLQVVAVAQVHSHDAVARDAEQLLLPVAVEFDDEQCDAVLG